MDLKNKLAEFEKETEKQKKLVKTLANANNSLNNEFEKVKVEYKKLIEQHKMIEFLLDGNDNPLDVQIIAKQNEQSLDKCIVQLEKLKNTIETERKEKETMKKELSNLKVSNEKLKENFNEAIDRKEYYKNMVRDMQRELREQLAVIRSYREKYGKLTKQSEENVSKN